MDDGFGNLLLFRRFAFSSKKLNLSGLFWLNLVRARVMKKNLKNTRSQAGELFS